MFRKVAYLNSKALALEQFALLHNIELVRLRQQQLSEWNKLRAL